MLKAVFSGRKKPAVIFFGDFYKDWISKLAVALLPDLRSAMASPSVAPMPLAVQVNAIHEHLQLYYTALDEAAAIDVAQCLLPPWRTSLEKPFLWLGDLHPYLFSNLLRKLLEDQENEEDDETDARSQICRRGFTASIDQIECGVRLMAPALAARAREAQLKIVTKLGEDWLEKKDDMKKILAAEMDELAEVVVHANRLRRGVLADILTATTPYQAALFLQALAQFVVGFHDEKLRH